jgi:hypothetical protein
VTEIEEMMIEDADEIQEAHVVNIDQDLDLQEMIVGEMIDDVTTLIDEIVGMIDPHTNETIEMIIVVKAIEDVINLQINEEIEVTVLVTIQKLITTSVATMISVSILKVRETKEIDVTDGEIVTFFVTN